LKHRIHIALLGAALLAPVAPLLAHHAPSAIFDMKKTVTLKGTLTKVNWVNPHINIELDVKEADGAVAHWMVESQPPRYYTKVGVTRADFVAAVGKSVSVEVVTALDGSKYAYLKAITFADGNRYSTEDGQSGASK